MQPSFQSIISKNQFSLPAICLLAIVIWILSPTKDVAMWDIPDYGIWYMVPEILQKGLTGQIIGLIVTSIIVYTMVEFSNSLVLLRVSSRMLSTTLAMLMAICMCLHKFQPAHIAMLMALLSYLFLFTSYQKASPALSLTSHLFASITSIVCPKMLLFIIPLWIFQIMLGAFNFKSFIASLLAIMIPYWFFFTFTVLANRIDIFIGFFVNACDIIMPKISELKENQVLAAIYVSATFIIGATHFVFTKAQDKLRQRSVYEIITLHGILVHIAIFFMPHCLNLLLGLLIIDTSILGGRFWVVCDNKFTHSLFILQIIIAGIIIALTINM